jgi:hypothetical protein
LPAVHAQVPVARPACLTVCDLEGHARTQRERDGRRRLQSLPAVHAQVTVARPACLVVCDLEGHAHACREVGGRRGVDIFAGRLRPSARGSSRMLDGV